MEDYAAAKARCLAEGMLYEDPDYPAEAASIYFTPSNPKWVDAEWKRPGELCDSAQFSVDGATRFDIGQGSLGNCWFISAVSLLTTNKELFDKVVIPGQTFDSDYAGIFHFRFWRFGEWMDVCVDDRLPTKNGTLIFCRNRKNTNEFWAALMEKAFAKIHGCYQALDLGYTHDALVDFTGGIGEFIDLEERVPDDLFSMLQRIFSMNSLIGAAINVKDEAAYEDKQPNGLLTGHAYSITNILQLTLDGVEHNLLRLRNPWGQKEWNGAWSDGSPEWEKVSDNQKAECNLVAADDGEFWFPYEDFITNFHTIHICHLTPSSACGGTVKTDWNVQTHHGSWVAGVTAGGCMLNTEAYWMNPQYFVSLRDPDKSDDDKTCMLVVSLIQKYRRQMKTILKTIECKDEAIGFNLLKFPGKAPEVLDGEKFTASDLWMQNQMESMDFLRERSFRFSLSPGTYCIMPCTYSEGTEAEFMLRIASQKPITSGEVDGESAQVPLALESGPLPQSKKFTRLYEKFVGDDEMMDARELCKMLNKAFKRDQDEDFSKETCRALINWATNKGSSADIEECKKIWRQFLALRKTFDEFDVDSSGELDKKELRQALRNLGFKFSRNLVAQVASTYCGKAAGLSLDDFVLVAIKTQLQFEKYQKLSAKGSVTISLTEWLETTLVG